MIFCERINDYVDQEEKCVNCIFYLYNEDTCDLENWHPGLIKGRKWNKDE